jgi:hypothetical protein
MKLFKWLIINPILLLLTSCTFPTKEESTISFLKSGQKLAIYDDLKSSAERRASPSGREILTTGRQMIEDQLVLPGGCWDYINEVYNRAGYPNKAKKRQTVFKGSKQKGPYAEVSLIQPGDFLEYINHSYNDIEHSAIFVDWINFPNKEALMLSYGGERRREPARYLPYDLSHVYRIVRPTN